MKLPRFQTVDWIIYIIPVLLVVTGIATIYTVSFVNKGNSLAYSQVTSMVIGLVLMLVLTFLDYRLLRSLAIPAYLVGAALLGLLIVPSFRSLPFVISSLGSTRWIDLGFFQLQPSELFKFFLILTLAAYFSRFGKNIRWYHVIGAALITLVPVLMTLKQPDLGTAMVLVIILVANLVAVSLSKIYYKVMGLLVLIVTPLMWFVLKDYQKERLLVFLNPQHDPSGSGYNVLQSIIAVGSGGLTGRGFGQGSQSQLNFLPVAHTDFVFAGLAEATGFVGVVVLIVAFVVLFVRMINVARVSKDDFGMYLAIGAVSMLLFQFIVNIGMNISLMPVTGIPLPFVSYGGTSLIINFVLIGILQSIYLRHKKITF
ncbi:MAG: rod shape-determining protein RodA [bacterium]|nr:rod shape-determining protein RodA [bacterium]